MTLALGQPFWDLRGCRLEGRKPQQTQESGFLTHLPKWIPQLTKRKRLDLYSRHHKQRSCSYLLCGIPPAKLASNLNSSLWFWSLLFVIWFHSAPALTPQVKSWPWRSHQKRLSTGIWFPRLERSRSQTEATGGQPLSRMLLCICHIGHFITEELRCFCSEFWSRKKLSLRKWI